MRCPLLRGSGIDIYPRTYGAETVRQRLNQNGTVVARNPDEDPLKTYGDLVTTVGCLPGARPLWSTGVGDLLFGLYRWIYWNIFFAWTHSSYFPLFPSKGQRNVFLLKVTGECVLVSLCTLPLRMPLWHHVDK